MNTNIVPTCAQCGSELIVVSTVTEKPEGSLFPQTTTLYRCSNKACQDERDRETEKRLKLKKERAVQEQKRSEERAKKKLDYLQHKSGT